MAPAGIRLCRLWNFAMSVLSNCSTYPSLSQPPHYAGNNYRTNEPSEELKFSPQFSNTMQVSSFLFPALQTHQADPLMDPVQLAEFDHNIKQTAGNDGFQWSDRDEGRRPLPTSYRSGTTYLNGVKVRDHGIRDGYNTTTTTPTNIPRR
ncbi:hypothetical protein VTH82DRAFT_1551 [Thermothelomyces myriococcoides]